MHLAACRTARLAGLLAAAAALSPASWAQTAAANPHLARSLAATCANCHGTQGQARGAMPALAGQPAERTVTLMGEFRSGKRPATIMHQIAKGYTDEQIQLVATYFASQPQRP